MKRGISVDGETDSMGWETRIKGYALSQYGILGWGTCQVKWQLINMEIEYLVIVVATGYAPSNFGWPLNDSLDGGGLDLHYADKNIPIKSRYDKQPFWHQFHK